MILLIDNYDSFSYNLYQMIGAMDSNIKVIRNDAMSCSEMEGLNPNRLIISPGPGRPDAAGESERAVRHFEGRIPILGICLGHQGICESYGAKVVYARKLMHGKQSDVTFDKEEKIFKGLTEPLKVARYHSLAVSEEEFPECLKVIARTDDGEVMAVKHKEFDTYGLQFHPESVLTPEGEKILRNFLNL